ncbi:arylsulfatase A-like [Acanthaster planci]|uniref:Arylsulfatase A-like n=1 Tax=Acanthaster planci TaxID=133434 RepID=A0A8B7Z802_ACAPL|nr:arylsulfatase A-like [Acanthaster planci]
MNSVVSCRGIVNSPHVVCPLNSLQRRFWWGELPRGEFNSYQECITCFQVNMAAPSALQLCILFGVFPLIICDGAKLSPPNIVILFADDLGFGDLETYGHPTSVTPNLNQLSASGLQFMQFYVASSVCSPSRAALLTGRYQTRSGVWPGVFIPDSTGGLQHNEVTIADMLKPLNYSTAIIGKWHLGVGQNGEYLPTNQGFDEYYGIPYSHDMCPCPVCFYPHDHCFNDCDPEYASCPLFHNGTIVEQPTDLLTLEQRYTNHARNYIATNAKSRRPFFLYYAYQHTHHPQFASKAFRNSTSRGTFGDSLAELDWSIGQVVQQLKDSGVADKTFVFFTADNGPSILNQNRGGSAGLLKCGKGTTYEGGQRVPAIALWPGKIQPGRTRELASSLDLLPTIANLTGAPLPAGKVLDGVDMSEILFHNRPSQRETFIYYPENPNPTLGIFAVRYKQYKAHYFTRGNKLSGSTNRDHDCRDSAKLTPHDPPLLFNLDQDPGERYDLSADPKYKSLLEKIAAIKGSFEAGMTWGRSQINGTNPSVEPCCSPGCSPFPACCRCKGSGINFIPV